MTTVLIVDDEIGFCRCLSALLQRRGFETIEAFSAHSALAHLEDPETKIEVMVADVVMPHMDGLKLADQVKERNPNVKILFMSGYSLPTLEREFGMSQELLPVFLQKPFEAATLAAKIHAMLGISV